MSRGSSAERVPPLLAQAYAAFEANRLDEAGNLYNQLLRTEPMNIDALLGLAAIAMQQGKIDEATKHYLQILRLDPRHALAQSGLIAILGRADPLAAEARLKQLIARDPAPFLYFTLGNLYADQSQWAQAQQAYFQAYHLEPGNPDYAYNLAVGLEHLSQPGARARLLPHRGAARRGQRPRQFQPAPGPGADNPARVAARIAGGGNPAWPNCEKNCGSASC